MKSCVIYLIHVKGVYVNIVAELNNVVSGGVKSLGVH